MTKLAPNPAVAYDNIHNVSKLVDAMKVLDRLNALTVDVDGVGVTEVGDKLLDQYGLYVDGNITPEGEQLLSTA